MGELIAHIIYMVAVFPFYIFMEVTDIITKFLKDKKIYDGWDTWHSLLVLLIILGIIFYTAGVR